MSPVTACDYSGPGWVSIGGHAAHHGGLSGVDGVQAPRLRAFGALAPGVVAGKGGVGVSDCSLPQTQGAWLNWTLWHGHGGQGAWPALLPDPPTTPSAWVTHAPTQSLHYQTLTPHLREVVSYCHLPIL